MTQESTPTRGVIDDSRLEMEFLNLTSDLSQTIRDKRKVRGWAQIVLADKLEMSKTTLVGMELGKVNPSLKTLLKVALTLGYKLEIRFVKR